MDPLTSESLLTELRQVDAERLLRSQDPALQDKVQELKRFQQARFAHTYADLLANPRYASVTRFFLDELYGPGDFSRRDAQFARVVPALIRLFPAEVAATVARLAQLHALSEQLDTRMAQCMVAPPLDADRYGKAWRQVGEPNSRQRQIDLTMQVGLSLDRLTAKPLLRQSLRLMRGPAQMSGLAELQRFLETGFDTFKAMRGAAEFLSTVRQREEALARALFSPNGDDAAKALGQLP